MRFGHTQNLEAFQPPNHATKTCMDLNNSVEGIVLLAISAVGNKEIGSTCEAIHIF